MPSLMETEAAEAPAAIARLLAAEPERWRFLGRRLAAFPPAFLATVARGSSDHAASYLGYLTTARLGRVTASLPLSLITLHAAPLAMRGALAVAISQSGQSPDLVETLIACRAAGAETVALVNDTAAPLGRAAVWCFGLQAGQERAVAATKSMLASLAAAALLVAEWAGDAALSAALAALPEALSAAAAADWSAAVAPLAAAERMMVVGRGLSQPIAQEAALKLKETAGLHAEAISAAEVRHGPMALLGPGYPVLVFATRGPALASILAAAAEMRASGATVLLAAPAECAERALTIPETGHPALDPLAALACFYRLAARIAGARGLDPDHPRHLHKITRTR